MGTRTPPATIEVAGRQVSISNPDKVFFSARGETKLDLANYYCAVGEGALRGVFERPTVLKRYPDGAEGSFFFQKRVPASRPDWLETVVVSFPSGEHAEELCPVDVAHLIWAVNLGCLDLNPWPVRRGDVDHPDELRVDLDPQPGVSFDAVRVTALAAREVLEENGLTGLPKTSGSRGLHIVVPIEPRWGFGEVRRSALALARELEARLPGVATSAWWKQDRGERVFVDYNQNARDRTVASAYSVRANPEGRVSAPLTWDEVPDVDPADLTIETVPDRYRRLGDLGIAPEGAGGDLSGLLELSDRQAAAGLGEAPLPPFYAKAPGEPLRSPGRGSGRAPRKVQPPPEV
ncbi:MAG: ATP-dependent ligase [Acidimicrobiaceae bacterium]|nr:ATP-dependent ligase [Acidimicrobiaceae bacterium]